MRQIYSLQSVADPRERQGVGAPPPGNRESATVIVTFKKGNSSYLIFTDEKNLQTTVINK